MTVHVLGLIRVGFDIDLILSNLYNYCMELFFGTIFQDLFQLETILEGVL